MRFDRRGVHHLLNLHLDELTFVRSTLLVSPLGPWKEKEHGDRVLGHNASVASICALAKERPYTSSFCVNSQEEHTATIKVT